MAGNTPASIAKNKYLQGQAISKCELSILYGVSSKTLYLWMKRIPGGALISRRRILSPEELRIFAMFYGKPDLKQVL